MNYAQRVPTAEIRPVVERAIREHGGIRVVSQLTRVPERRLYGIMVGEYANAAVDTVDRILVGLDLTYLWHLPPLSGYYAPDAQEHAPTRRELWERARELRAQGWSYPRIGRHLGIDHTSALYACDAYYRLQKTARTRARYQARKLATDPA